MTNMENPAQAFERVISPIGSEEFFQLYWEKQFLHVRRTTPDYYDYALTVGEIDRYFQVRHISPNYISVLKNGENCPLEQWADAFQRISTHNTQHVVNIRKLLNLFNSGATIVINSGETGMPPLGNLCRALEYEFKNPVQANIYITPPQNQGFKPHFDTHNVLILQIHGRKSWNLYDSPIASPVKGFSADASLYKEREPQEVIELEPGDLLYIPRGMVHSARSEKNTSIHVTLGPTIKHWSSLLKIMAKEADQNPDFRRLLPHGLSDQRERAEFISEFTRQVERFLARSDFSAIIDNHFIEEQRTDSRERFTDLLRLEQLTMNSVVRRRSNMSYLIERNSQWIIIRFEGEEINLPLFLESAMLKIFDEQSFEVREIEGIPNDAGKLAIVRRFVQAGFLTIVDV